MTTFTTAAPRLADTSRDVLLEKARDVAEFAWSRQADGDRDRRLPDAVVEKLLDSGLTSLLQQERWGGAESDPMTALDVGREIARGSGSLGWLFALTSFHTWYMAFTSEKLQQEVYGDNPDTLVADAFAPVGKIDRIADGYLATGQWKFGSGIEWAGWIAVGGMAVPAGGDTPELQLFFLPRNEIKIVDDWKTLGLRGTASRSIIADQVFVPEHRVLALGQLAGPGGRGPIAEKSPLWRLPLMTTQGLAVMTAVTGISQRIIDEFTATTRTRVRWLELGAEQRENPAAQIALAGSATQWDATWALAQRYAQSGWDRGVKGEWVLTDEERAQYFSWRGYVGRSCVELSDQLFISSGALALFDSNPMQQLFRDVHSAGVHVGLDRGDAYTSRGRVAMGLPGHPFH